MSETALAESLSKILKPIKWLNWRGRRAAKSRAKEIRQVLELLRKYETGIMKDKDIAREEFRGAVQRYVLGFYEDSIYHSCFSVEMALLICLNEKLIDGAKENLHERINRKHRPMSFTFGTIKGKCEEKPIRILKTPATELVSDILRIRNSHVHAYNFVSATICMQQKYLSNNRDLINTLMVGKRQWSLLQRLLAIFLVSRVANDDLEKKLKAFESLSNFRWCSKDDIRESVEKDVEKHINNVKTLTEKVFATATSLKIRELWKSSRELMEQTQRDSYMKKRANETLNIAYEILKKLNIL